jgi:transposase
MKKNKSATLSTASADASASALSDLSAGSATKIAVPEVYERPHRRRLSKEHKLSILEQADALGDTGGVGALLRREGLYYSSLAEAIQ